LKLCTFEIHTHLGRHRRLGAMFNQAAPEGIIDLNFACAARLAAQGEVQPQKLADVFLPGDMRAFLNAGPGAMKMARETIAFCEQSGIRSGPNGETLLYDPTEIKLLAPLPNPASVRDFYAFEAHVKKGFEKRGEAMPPEWYEIPVYYRSGHHNIIGTGQDVPWPSFTQKLDYELELAVIIGKKGANIPAAAAREYIAGFTVMNDFSARDIQRQEMKVRLGPAKGKEWCTALGPYLVTPDEIGDPYNLSMTARINGDLWSEGNSHAMYWKFEQMIEFLSKDDTIYPSDVIGSGTVGTGCGLELDRWVQRGDVMELEIEKIGVLQNRVV
jgi:2-keto-4-pentenoate hydratase/2-oxohepta-3-ene-1,7-dioic acid hydratase in catechol pathway